MARVLLLAVVLAVLVALSAAQSSSSSSSSTGTAPAMTFCQTYSGTTTNATLQVALLTTIVTRAVVGGIFTTGGTTYDIPGLFNASGPLYAIFSGQVQYRVGAPNYITNSAALGLLAGKLVAYFGTLFGCTATGYPVPQMYSMYLVHANMSINNTQETYFNTQLALTLESLGVPADVVTSVAAPALGLFNRCGAPIAALNTTALVQICGTADCPLATGATASTCSQDYGFLNGGSSSSSSTGMAPTATFCQTYSGTTTNATLQVALLTTIVTRAVVGGIFTTGGTTYDIPGLFNASGPLYAIFSGQVQYRVGAPNYVTNSAALGLLAGKLVAYFGALFGCTATGYPAVVMYSMYLVHANMSIDNAMETYFNTQLALTLESLGVPADVVTSVAAPALGLFNRCGAPIAALNTTALVQICGAADCPLATGATASTCSQYYGFLNGGSSSSSTGTAPTMTFCQTYSGTTTNATLQVALLTTIVTRAVVGGIFTTGGTTYDIPGLFNASGPLYAIFSGQVQYRVGAPNYVTNSAALGLLAGKLVAYFGALFGCTASGYPAVVMYNMYLVHANMSIDNAMETYFHTQLALTLESLGVPASVVTSVAAPALGLFNRCGAPIAALNATAPVQICGTADCPLAETYSSCVQYYGAAASSSSSSTAGSNAAAAKYSAGVVSVVLAAVAAALLL